MDKQLKETKNCGCNYLCMSWSCLLIKKRSLVFAGIATITPFLVLCLDWLAWRAPPNTTLEYDFRIRPPGAPSSSAFPFFFGSERMVDPVGFPVGVAELDFDLEVAAWIIDSLGDYYELITTVKVSIYFNVNFRPVTLLLQCGDIVLFWAMFLY